MEIEKSVIYVSMFLALFISSLTMVSLREVKAMPDITYIDFPNHTIPLGIEYSSNLSLAYVAMMYNLLHSAIAEVDTINMTYEIFVIPVYDLHISELAIDGDKNIWVGPMANATVKFYRENRTFKIIELPYYSGPITLYFKDFIWTIHGYYLMKINYTTNTVEDSYYIPGFKYIGDMIGYKDCIYMSSINMV